MLRSALRWLFALLVTCPVSTRADLACARALRQDLLPVNAFYAEALALAEWWQLEGKAAALRNGEVRYPAARVRGALDEMRRHAAAWTTPGPELRGARHRVLETIDRLRARPEVSESVITNAVLGYACMAERLERGRWPWGPIESAGESSIVYWRDSIFRTLPGPGELRRPELELYWEGPDGASPLAAPERLTGYAAPAATSPLLFWPYPLSDRDFNVASPLDLALVEIAHVGREADNDFMYAYRFVEHDLGHAADVRRFLDADAVTYGSREGALRGRMRVVEALFRGALPAGLTIDRAHRAYFSWHHEPFRLEQYEREPAKQPYARWLRTRLAGAEGTP